MQSVNKSAPGWLQGGGCVRRKLFGLGLAIMFVLLASPEATAQTAPPPPPRPVDEPSGEPRFNLSGGYAYMRDYSWDEHLLLGWVATLGFRITKNVSIVGEVGGGHGEFRDTGFTIQRYALLGGMKVMGGEGRLRPFFQGLAGMTRQGGDVGLAEGYAFQPGGGVDFSLTEKIVLRGQADFRWMRENDENWSSYRFSGGLVFSFGKKQ